MRLAKTERASKKAISHTVVKNYGIIWNDKSISVIQIHYYSVCLNLGGMSGLLMWNKNVNQCMGLTLWSQEPKRQLWELLVEWQSDTTAVDILLHDKICSCSLNFPSLRAAHAQTLICSATSSSSNRSWSFSDRLRSRIAKRWCIFGNAHWCFPISQLKLQINSSWKSLHLCSALMQQSKLWWLVRIVASGWFDVYVCIFFSFFFLP